MRGSRAHAAAQSFRGRPRDEEEGLDNFLDAAQNARFVASRRCRVVVSLRSRQRQTRIGLFAGEAHVLERQPADGTELADVPLRYPDELGLPSSGALSSRGTAARGPSAPIDLLPAQKPSRSCFFI